MRARLLLSAIASVFLPASCGAPRALRPETDPLGPNAGCYVCHVTFVREELSRTHLKAKIGCIDCHGVSVAHANDENVGATPPDVTFPRDRVSSFCRTCHESHDVAPERVVARWRARRAGKAATGPAGAVTCTDCHGRHRIDKRSHAPAQEGYADRSLLPHVQDAVHPGGDVR